MIKKNVVFWRVWLKKEVHEKIRYAITIALAPKGPKVEKYLFVYMFEYDHSLLIVLT